MTPALHTLTRLRHCLDHGLARTARAEARRLLAEVDAWAATVPPMERPPERKAVSS